MQSLDSILASLLGQAEFVNQPPKTTVEINLHYQSGCLQRATVITITTQTDNFNPGNQR